MDISEEMTTKTTSRFLEMNITELKRVLQNLERCIEKDVKQSWRNNPDPQSAQVEIDNAGAWR